MATQNPTLNLDESLFNYFCLAVLDRFRQIDGKEIPEIKYVLYCNDNGQTKENQIRLPGGGVQFKDIADAVGVLIENPKYQNIKEHLKWFLLEVNEKEEKFRENFKHFPENSLEEKKVKHTAFIEALNYLGSAALETFSESVLREILKQSQKQTIVREMKEETDNEVVVIRQYMTARTGNHCKYGFLVKKINGSDSYAGSSEGEIRSSDWMPAEQLLREIFKGHKNFLQESFLELGKKYHFNNPTLARQYAKLVSNY